MMGMIEEVFNTHTLLIKYQIYDKNEIKTNKC